MNLDLTTGFLVFVAAAGWLNVRFLRLPTASVMLLTGMAGGALLLIFQSMTLQRDAWSTLAIAIRHLDFPKAVLGYMLAFLLFAGSTKLTWGSYAIGFWLWLV
jgi:hypothetical protein